MKNASRDEECHTKTDVPGLEIDYLNGFCPVQSEGRIAGTRYYFKARGQIWRFEVGNGMYPDWTVVERYGKGLEAGWMPLGEAKAFLERAARAYMASPAGVREAVLAMEAEPGAREPAEPTRPGS